MRSDALRHRDALYRKVDDFFDRVHARHPGSMECGAGCHDCCADDLTVTRIEADAIQTLLDARATRGAPPPVLGPRGACAALDARGVCSIYEARPLVCRSHGLAVKTDLEVDEPADGREARRHLPLAPAFVRSTCPKNFKGDALAALDPGDVLDQTTLSSIIFTLERAFDPGAPERVALRDLLARAIAQAPPSSRR